MKKIIASAVGLMLAGGVAATTACAVESQFGGYWRTRFTFDDNMAGTPASAAKAAIPAYVDANGNAIPAQAAKAKKDAADNTDTRWFVDTRTRLYYTAKFNDDFKFVNRFEFNNTWGDANGGSLNADGTGIFRIKHSYADFNLGKVNTKVGIQGGTISRGFIFADDFSGAIVTADLGSVKVPFVYMAAVDKGSRPATSAAVANGAPDVPLLDKDGVPVLDAKGNAVLVAGASIQTTAAPTDDVNIYSVMPEIKINDNVMVTPHFTYENAGDLNVYWLGVDADLKLDAVTAWATGIYNFGDLNETVDISAYLLAVGADAGIVHGQAFYASGDDDANDTDANAFTTIGTAGTDGTSYYWSEIMGYGIFDSKASNGSPADHLSNIWAANVGVTVKPMDKLTASLDVWYAQLAEKDAAGNSDLGLEFDGKLTYEIMDNLNADFVLAYLVAGDATGDDDVVESGLQLSLKF